MENFEKLKMVIFSLEDDKDKFYDKQNAAAGKRIRKGMQELKKIAQAIRIEIQQTRKKPQ